MKTYALLDDGSTITLIDKKFAHELSGCEKVEFEIICDYGKYDVKNAVTVSDLKLPSQSVSGDLVRAIAKEASVFIQPYNEAKPKILIGQDHWRLLATKETREISGTSAAVSLSSLGWAVHGLVSSKSATSKSASSNFTVFSKSNLENESNENLKFEIEKLNELVKSHFEIDNFSVNEIVKPTKKK